MDHFETAPRLGVKVGDEPIAIIDGDAPNGRRKTIRPAGPLIADNSEVVLMAAIEGAGITFTPDWLAGPALRERKLVEVLPGWGGKAEGGVYAILPPGRLTPTKTRLFVDDIAKSIKAGWRRRAG